MKILIVADGQSPHARNWILRLVERGYEVHLATTYPCDTAGWGVASVHVLPVDFSARARASEKAATMGSAGPGASGSPISRLRGTPLWKALVRVRNASAPFLARARSRQLRRIVQSIRPDLVHALRIPFEGILAGLAVAPLEVPFAVSTWGNDFTLFAASSPDIARLTKTVVERADGLHSDCRKDVAIAYEFGFRPGCPALVAPGNGGVRGDVFHEGEASEAARGRWNVAAGAPVAINPRGLKPYVRNEEFLRAVPLVLRRFPDAVFLLASMQGKAHVESFAAELGIAKSLRLLPSVPHAEMADLFRLAEVTVSPSDHDGTPNTLLEAMACGSFPVAGDIPSVREWIEHGSNGLLFDQRDPASIAQAIVQAFEDAELRARAKAENRRVIAERALIGAVSDGIDRFYRQLVQTP